jgi:glycosyltransferase involved in cell wall biosynthesis
MNVLLLTSAKSGPLRSANAIAKYLAERKDQVYVYLLDSPDCDLDFDNVFVDKPSTVAESVGYYGRIVRLAMLRKARFSPNVVLTSFALSIPFVKTCFPSAAIVYRMMGVPRIQFSEGILKLAYAAETSMAKRYAKRVPTITTGEHYRRLIASEWKTDVYCILNGVDTEFYEPIADKETLKRELGLSNYDYVIILGLTRFNEVFRPKMYIKWYVDALSRHKHRKILTLILGKATEEQRQETLEIVDEYQIKEQTSNHLFRTDYVKDTHLLREFYQISDFLISFQPQCLMEKEALACGVPVVTEFWEGKNAPKQLAPLEHKLVKEKFISIIEILLEDEKSRKAFSKMARTVAEEDFSYRAMGEQYRKILETSVSNFKTNKISFA